MHDWWVIAEPGSCSKRLHMTSRYLGNKQSNVFTTTAPQYGVWRKYSDPLSQRDKVNVVETMTYSYLLKYEFALLTSFQILGASFCDVPVFETSMVISYDLCLFSSNTER